MDAYIVIAVMVLMIIAFMMNRWALGLITVSCCIVLGVTGVLTPTETFSGFCNSFVVMLAGAFVVTNALAKTSFVKHLQKWIIRLQNGKSGIRLMAIFVFSVILLATFMPGPAMLAIIIVMARNLNDAGEVNAARVIFPAAMLTTIWNGRIAIGIGAGQFAVINGFLEPYGEQYTVSMFDPTLAGLIPGLALAVYTIFAYKLLPHKAMEQNDLEAPAAAAQAVQPEMSKRNEILTYIAFVAMLLMMVLNQWTGSLLYIGPALCAVILAFLNVITVEEIKKSITADVIFMLAGIFTLTNALSSTGAGQMIGESILSLFGGATTQIGLVALFTGITVIITNFMSNNATMYSVIPVAITTALAAGLNPVPVVLAVDVASKCASLLPCSSGEAAMCFGASGYTPKETWKFVLPAAVITYVGTVAGSLLFFS